jgi:hypothetical protein
MRMSTEVINYGKELIELRIMTISNTIQKMKIMKNKKRKKMKSMKKTWN